MMTDPATTRRATYADLLDAERRALALQEFIAFTINHYAARMPDEWITSARLLLDEELPDAR
jgi:hypothetical protein